MSICEICGRISPARDFCEFGAICGRTCANKLGVGSMEGIRRAAWVWQGCHTLLHLWASVQSVGGYSPPEISVNSVGGLAQTNLEWVLWKEFGGRRGYGRDAIPSYENSHGLHGCAQIRREVCQNSLILKKSQSPDFHKPGLCYF